MESLHAELEERMARFEERIRKNEESAVFSIVNEKESVRHRLNRIRQLQKNMKREMKKISEDNIVGSFEELLRVNQSLLAVLAL